MSRSDYYPRRSARVLSSKPRPAPEDVGEGGQVGVISCAVCHIDLPIRLHHGEPVVQIPLGLFCETPPEVVCALEHYLAARTDESWDAALSSDRIRSEVHPS